MKKYPLIIILILVILGVIFFTPLTPIGEYVGYRTVGRVNCMLQGKNWGYTANGIASSPGCFTPYADAGKLCKNSDECDGRCMLATGTCEEDNRYKCGIATPEKPDGEPCVP